MTPRQAKQIIVEINKYKVDDYVFDTYEEAEEHLQNIVSRGQVEKENLAAVRKATGRYVPVKFGKSLDIVLKSKEPIFLFLGDPVQYFEEPISVLTPDEFLDLWVKQKKDDGIHSENFGEIIKGLLFLLDSADVDVSFRDVLTRLSKSMINGF